MSKYIKTAEIVQLNRDDVSTRTYELKARFTFGTDFSCDVRVEANDVNLATSLFSNVAPAAASASRSVFCVLLRYNYPDDEVGLSFKYRLFKVTNHAKVFLNDEEVTVSQTGAWLTDEDVIKVGNKRFKYRYVLDPVARSSVPRAASEERNEIILKMFESVGRSRKYPRQFASVQNERLWNNSKIDEVGEGGETEERPTWMKIVSGEGALTASSPTDKNRRRTYKLDCNNDSCPAPARKPLPNLQQTHDEYSPKKRTSNMCGFEMEECAQSPTVRNLLDRTGISQSDEVIEAVEEARRACEDVVELRVLNTSSGILRFINQLGEKTAEHSSVINRVPVDCVEKSLSVLKNEEDANETENRTDADVRDVALMLVGKCASAASRLSECAVAHAAADTSKMLDKHEFEESLGLGGYTRKTSTPVRHSLKSGRRSSVRKLAFANRAEENKVILGSSLHPPRECSKNESIERADRELSEMLKDGELTIEEHAVSMTTTGGESALLRGCGDVVVVDIDNMFSPIDCAATIRSDDVIKQEILESEEKIDRKDMTTSRKNKRSSLVKSKRQSVAAIRKGARKASNLLPPKKATPKKRVSASMANKSSLRPTTRKRRTTKKTPSTTVKATPAATPRKISQKRRAISAAKKKQQAAAEPKKTTKRTVRSKKQTGNITTTTAATTTTATGKKRAAKSTKKNAVVAKSKTVSKQKSVSSLAAAPATSSKPSVHAMVTRSTAAKQASIKAPSSTAAVTTITSRRK